VSGTQLHRVSCYYSLTIVSFLAWTRSLMGRWGCNLLVQYVGTLGFKLHRTFDLNLLSHLRFPQPGGPSFTPGYWVPFLSLLMTHGDVVEVF
jgi:hypothetical protein